jgi:hypothetical protein
MKKKIAHCINPHIELITYKCAKQKYPNNVSDRFNTIDPYTLGTFIRIDDCEELDSVQWYPATLNNFVVKIIQPRLYTISLGDKLGDKHD